MKVAISFAAKGIAGGAGLGLLVFLVEGALLLKSGAIGVKIDTTGPFAALLQAVRPLLPALLVKVAVVYALAGAAIGAVLAFGFQPAPRPSWSELPPFPAPGGRRHRVSLRVLSFLGAWLAAWTLFAWERAIWQPALFLDLPGDTGLLELLASSGAPWHPRAAALLAAIGVATWAFFSRGPRRAVIALVLVAFALLPRSQWPEPPLARTVNQDASPVSIQSSAKAGTIILIGVDAFRPDRLRALGARKEVAPHLDAFVSEATLFTRAYTPIGQTEPAWRSLLTARWPQFTGVRYPLTPQSQVVPLPTFVSRLSDAGYATHFATDCSRFHFEDALSGFALRDQPPRGAINFLLEKLRFRGVGMFADHALGAAWLPEFVENRALAGIHDPLGYVERLAERWVSLARERPALLAFHATAAHFPGDATYPFYRRFVPETEPLSRRLRMQFAPISTEAQRGTWTREGSEALYDELLAQADAQLGVLFAALREHGLYDDATIIVFSDHGESFHVDRPDLAGATPVHGARLGEEENRILLAVKIPRNGGAATVNAPPVNAPPVNAPPVSPNPDPNANANANAPAANAHGNPGAATAATLTNFRISRIDALVRLVDLGPTILELAGVQPLAGVDGESFAGVWRGEGVSPRMLYAETGFTHALPEVFDPEHAPGAPRAFSIYRIRPDGVAEVASQHHDAIIAEKDVGAFDGKSWIIDSPRKDGTILRRCYGPCDAPALETWLDSLHDSGEANQERLRTTSR